jgi:alkylhydroperoxidase family enzyme
MRLKTPRIAPVDLDALTEAQAEVLAPLRGGAPTGTGAPVLNIFRTLAQDPVALKAFLAWGQYVLSRRSGLGVRERELVILRVGFLCRAGYEWTQHAEIGLRGGLTKAELEMIKAGPSAMGWSDIDVLLLKAADALVGDHFIADDLWAELSAAFSPKACTDLVFTVGQYVQVCMILNTLGVQLDEGQALDPDLDFR